MMLTTVKKEGFQGCLFSKNCDLSQVVITFTGSDGGISNAKIIASFYEKHSIASLAIGYYKTKQTPDSMSLIQIEYIEKAILWLRLKGYKQIYIDALSKGTELALLVASTYKEIDILILRSPSYFISEGLDRNGQPSSTSCWSINKEEVNYTKYKFRNISVFKQLIKNKEFSLLKYNNDKVINVASIINFEKISSKMLLIYSENDTVWDSKKSCIKISELYTNNKIVCKAYNYISHLMLPKLNLFKKILFKIERRHFIRSLKERKDMNKKIIDFIKNSQNM